MAIRFFLDAGHGGKDSGATKGSRREADDVLKVVKKVGKKLEENYSNVVVGYSRTSDIYESPSKKASDGNSFSADYFFSFHRNAYNGAAKGWETEYKSHSTVKDGIMSDLNKRMKKIGFAIRGDKQRDNLAVLNQTSMPALLFEIGFIDNTGDNKIFDDHFDDIVDAFVDVIGDNCGLKKINSANTNKEEDKVAEKKEGCFAPIQNPDDCDGIEDFLHKRGFGAGEHNLALIAAVNCKKQKVKDALFKIALNGNLIKPDGLNKKD